MTQTLTIRAVDTADDLAGWVDHPDGPSIAYLQEAVGGLIERVYLSPLFDGLVMWAHEEALLISDPDLNHAASIMAGGSPIFGDVVLVREG